MYVSFIVLRISFYVQDNLWKNAINSRINQTATRAFDMAFIIGQRSYEGYEYYDFYKQVYQRLKGHPFWSNLSSESEASSEHYLMKVEHIFFSSVTFNTISSTVRLVPTQPTCMTRCFFTPWD